jgi:hypothetical protein
MNFLWRRIILDLQMTANAPAPSAHRTALHRLGLGKQTASRQRLSCPGKRVDDGGDNTPTRCQWRLLKGEMKIEDFSFGSIRIDGTVYEDDVVIDY